MMNSCPPDTRSAERRKLDELIASEPETPKKVGADVKPLPLEVHLARLVSKRVDSARLSGNESSDALKERFNGAMLNIYESAKRLKPPYHAERFMRMLAAYGGKETADRLLAADAPSEDFTNLFLRGKENLSLSVEYLVLQNPWKTFFSENQLAIARGRLLEVECALPAEDLLQMQHTD